MELLAGALIALILMIGVYAFVDSGVKDYVSTNDHAAAQSAGRAAMDIFVSEIMVAGYNPLGMPFHPVAQGTSERVRFLADLDGDGVIGTVSEANENLTYEFLDSDGDGLYELRRGVDLDGDGDFEDSGESVDSIAENVVHLSAGGSDVPFLNYDEPPPRTSSVRISFGVRSDHRDTMRKEYDVIPFRNEVILKNMHW